MEQCGLILIRVDVQVGKCTGTNDVLVCLCLVALLGAQATTCSRNEINWAQRSATRVRSQTAGRFHRAAATSSRNAARSRGGLPPELGRCEQRQKEWARTKGRWAGPLNGIAGAPRVRGNRPAEEEAPDSSKSCAINSEAALRSAIPRPLLLLLPPLTSAEGREEAASHVRR